MCHEIRKTMRQFTQTIIEYVEIQRIRSSLSGSLRNSVNHIMVLRWKGYGYRSPGVRRCRSQPGAILHRRRRKTQKIPEIALGR